MPKKKKEQKPNWLENTGNILKAVYYSFKIIVEFIIPYDK